MCGASGEIVRTFVARHGVALGEAGIEVAVVVLDDDREARQAPTRHLWRLATRQARVAGCSRPTALARILVYRALAERSASIPSDAPPPLPPHVSTVHVPTLNAPAAAEATRNFRCDLVCLMGARFLTRRTLRNIGVPVVNIHSSDPRWVRGGPVVVWEVLANRPEITLVVHEATEVLDSGAILAEGAQRIVYRGGLGATTTATMSAARFVVADLFDRVVRDVAAGSPQRTAFAPGTLRVTPSVALSLRAEALCRSRSRAATAAV
ncbi:MAG: hypothetical protein JO057_22740 [Chloroflexi bacterium]|nr:hypothetical protein [Chloroflexota bacterium]